MLKREFGLKRIASPVKVRHRPATVIPLMGKSGRRPLIKFDCLRGKGWLTPIKDLVPLFHGARGLFLPKNKRKEKKVKRLLLILAALAVFLTMIASCSSNKPACTIDR